MLKLALLSEIPHWCLHCLKLKTFPLPPPPQFRSPVGEEDHPVLQALGSSLVTMDMGEWMQVMPRAVDAEILK